MENFVAIVCGPDSLNSGQEPVAHFYEVSKACWNFVLYKMQGTPSLGKLLSAGGLSSSVLLGWVAELLTTDFLRNMLPSYSGVVEPYRKGINSPVTQHGTPSRSEFSTLTLWKPPKIFLLSASAELLVHGEESMQTLQFLLWRSYSSCFWNKKKLQVINVSRHDITHTGYKWTESEGVSQRCVCNRTNIYLNQLDPLDGVSHDQQRYSLANITVIFSSMKELIMYFITFSKCLEYSTDILCLSADGPFLYRSFVFL